MGHCRPHEILNSDREKQYPSLPRHWAELLSHAPAAVTWLLTVGAACHGSSTFSFHCSTRSLERIFFAGLVTCFIMLIQVFNGLYLLNNSCKGRRVISTSLLSSPAPCLDNSLVAFFPKRWEGRGHGSALSWQTHFNYVAKLAEPLATLPLHRPQF